MLSAYFNALEPIRWGGLSITFSLTGPKTPETSCRLSIYTSAIRPWARPWFEERHLNRNRDMSQETHVAGGEHIEVCIFNLGSLPTLTSAWFMTDVV